MDLGRRRVDLQHGHRALAHLWPHALPGARGLPHHAGRADDAAAAAAPLLCAQSGVGRQAELLLDAEYGGGGEGGKGVG